MQKALYILGQLADEDIEWMLAVGARYRLPPGLILIQEGETVDALYIVLEGALSIIPQASQGKEVARLGVGEIIGEISFIDHRPPSATVVAAQDSLLFRLDRERLDERFEQDAPFAARFYRALAVYLAGRLRHTTNRLAYSFGQALDEDSPAGGEFDSDMLDNADVAGARFERMLKRLSGN